MPFSAEDSSILSENVENSLASIGSTTTKTEDSVDDESSTEKYNPENESGLSKAKRGFWTSAEDAKLLSLTTNDFTTWQNVSKQIPGRSTKQCRERWTEHLDPSLDRRPFTSIEDAEIIRQQALIGNRWSVIATRLDMRGRKRTATSVKVRWAALSRKAKRLGLASVSDTLSTTTPPPQPLPPAQPPILSSPSHAVHPAPPVTTSHLPMPMNMSVEALMPAPMPYVMTQGYMQGRGFQYDTSHPYVFMPWGGGGARGATWFPYPTVSSHSPENYAYGNHGRDMYMSQHQSFAMHQHPHMQRHPLQGPGAKSSCPVDGANAPLRNMASSYFVS
mmetsp:Transcript_26600/g.26846  ORF Transcript_26600/g.26846 Transcript_26600/m.26846 type:complete len:332 (+) Transcript_26600:102-1097(+)|eukprot:CAMPEP_0182417906 /NCGR_PEP_ID=MMETSP1167-20130531/2356_1 /TAXON_ID=2988 /ORGANISM="Mallomonas Sp, Strain CCMP3275" /LENGTH=331 /DNA_ID=CAMNT_0024591765 /DNA_START=71 /DNA_END=1066 /DNA_ORIENTATION=+